MIYLLLLAFGLASALLTYLVLSPKMKPLSPLARQLRFQEQVWAQAYGGVATGAAAVSVVGRFQQLILRLFSPRGLNRVVEAGLTKAGLQISASKAISYHLVITILSYLLVAYAAASMVVGLVGLAAGAGIPVMAIMAMSGRRAARLEAQLAEALTLIAGSLKAGYSLPQTIDMVSREMKPPISEDFGQLIAQTRLGMSLDEGLARLAERTSSSTLSWMIMAIRIQHEVGGNLAEIFDVLAGTIREREQITRQVKVLTAEGRLSAVILIILPFLLALVLGVFNPAYIGLLIGTTIGLVMVGAAIFLLVIGALWMRKVVTIEV